MILIKQVGNHVVSEETALVIFRIVSVNQILDPWIFILCRKHGCQEFSQLYKRIRRKGSTTTGDHYSRTESGDSDIRLRTVSGQLPTSETSATDLDLQETQIAQKYNSLRKNNLQNGFYLGTPNGSLADVELHPVGYGKKHNGNGVFHSIEIEINDTRTLDTKENPPVIGNGINKSNTQLYENGIYHQNKGEIKNGIIPSGKFEGSTINSEGEIQSRDENRACYDNECEKNNIATADTKL